MEYKITRRIGRDSNVLSHHGIHGQKWGVRRYQNYDGSLTEEGKQRYGAKSYYILPKGSKLSSVSTIDDSQKYLNQDRPMYLYDTEDEWDRTVYKGPFAAYKIYKGAWYVYEHNFETVKDLRMPTDKERFDEFVRTFNNTADAPGELKKAQFDPRIKDVLSKEASNIDLHNLNSESDYRAAYEIFNHAMENYKQLSVTKKYMDLMQEKFDAMVDDNNYKIYNRVHNPIIVFKADTALKELGNEILLRSEIRRNIEKVNNELAKYGETAQA